MFLHAGWRSSGTWLWSCARAQPGVHALYEPLHENLARLRRADLPKIGPHSWRSRHAATDPYFAEYGALIPPHGRGVPLYQRRFAFEGFFLPPNQDDPALEAYLGRLLLPAATAGQHALLKFCRSLGRVAWMEQRFPTMLHAVVLRDARAQWRSGERLLAQTRNRYFTVAPILVLARNATHPLVRAACEALDVDLPPLGSTDMAYGMETVWRQVRRQDPATRYRGFLAYWTATALAALDSHALLIDTASIAHEPEHRATVQAALAEALGTRLDLAATPPDNTDLPEPPDGAAARQAAAAFARAFGNALPPTRLAKLLGCLDAPATPVLRRQRAEHALPAAKPRVPGRIGTAGMVVFANVLQRARRLHGRLSWRWGRK